MRLLWGSTYIGPCFLQSKRSKSIEKRPRCMLARVRQIEILKVSRDNSPEIWLERTTVSDVANPGALDAAIKKKESSATRVWYAVKLKLKKTRMRLVQLAWNYVIPRKLKSTWFQQATRPCDFFYGYYSIGKNLCTDARLINEHALYRESNLPSQRHQLW